MTRHLIELRRTILTHSLCPFLVKTSSPPKIKNDQKKSAVAKSTRESPETCAVITIDDQVDLSSSDSTELPTLTPDLSSDDEISLSDPEGMELNVVSFGRGIPDKVTRIVSRIELKAVSC